MRKLFKQKKAMVLILFSAILVMFVIMPMLFYKMYTKQAQFKRTLGETQMDLLEIYQTAQKDLFFIDQAAKLSAYQATHDLADNGGFSPLGSKCGNYLGYNLWSSQTESCYPNYKTNFKAYINGHLNQYFSTHPTEIKQNNYEFLLTKDSLIATALDNIHYQITKGDYTVKPSFKINISYNIDEYQLIITAAKKLLDQCKTKPDLKICVETNKPKNWALNYCDIFSPQERACLEQPGKVSFFDPTTKEFIKCGNCPTDATCDRYIDERYCNRDPCNLGCTWDGASCKKTTDITLNEKIFKFCVQTETKVLLYDKTTNTAEYKPITYKFAVDFSTP